MTPWNFLCYTHRNICFIHLLTSYRLQPSPNFEPQFCDCEQVFHAKAEDLQLRHCFAHAKNQLAKESYFRTLPENIYHPELCDGLHQNEHPHFVRSVFSIETKVFVYWGTYNDSSSSKIWSWPWLSFAKKRTDPLPSTLLRYTRLGYNIFMVLVFDKWAKTVSIELVTTPSSFTPETLDFRCELDYEFLNIPLSFSLYLERCL